MFGSYLGGIWRRCEPAGPFLGARQGARLWTAEGAETSLALRSGGAAALFTWEDVALLLRGYARPAGSTAPLDLERLAQSIRCHYLETGDLAVDDLDGSFSLALLDAAAGRVLLYRNLIGAGFTYYHADTGGLRFGSNLAALLDAVGGTPRRNCSVLPSFFLYRWVPGRETLFADFYRLLPGEQVCWDRRGLSRRQRHTFADLRDDSEAGKDPVERVDATTAAVLADCCRLRPGAANLLSGGIDSSYLQAMWNRAIPPEEGLPPSFTVSVDHPRSWADTDYAVTASRTLGSRHTLVPADGPFADYLQETLAATGEPPNHVQSAYFAHLAREMNSRGVQAGLCGEGADSLFGLEVANKIHNALVLRRWVPLRTLRQLGAAACGLLGWNLLGATFRLANTLYDITDLRHPVNRAAVFTDWEVAEKCFGTAAVSEASAARRSLLDLYAVPADPMQRTHAAGFLCEAADSASLWTTLFNNSGADLLCPYLDSRMLRLALCLPAHQRFPFRRPKDLLKRALARHAPDRLVRRPKLGFGQPIFEWLAPGGQLRPLVDSLHEQDFLDRETLQNLRHRPTWFLYSLLCYDLWDKLFIRRCLARPLHAAAVGTDLTLASL
jgi:asparagine synthase (glutamine-hydrolysing)